MKTGDLALEVRNDLAWPIVARRVVLIAGFTLLAGLVAWSAILAKESRAGTPLLGLRTVSVVSNAAAAEPDRGESFFVGLAPRPSLIIVDAPTVNPALAPASPDDNASIRYVNDAEVRWFNGRPAKPARTMMMTVTAYSPDARSCGESADGLTATLHSVDTNGHRLVAADPKLLAYGSMLTIPGYDSGQIVPVLDCGGAIKGRHIDLLFPTHEEARKWGVKKLRVTVWKYIDGKPADNPRKLR